MQMHGLTLQRAPGKSRRLRKECLRLFPSACALCRKVRLESMDVACGATKRRGVMGVGHGPSFCEPRDFPTDDEVIRTRMEIPC